MYGRYSVLPWRGSSCLPPSGTWWQGQRTRDKLRRRETRFKRYDGREEDYNWQQHRLLKFKSVVSPLFNTLIIELKLLAHWSNIFPCYKNKEISFVVLLNIFIKTYEKAGSLVEEQKKTSWGWGMRSSAKLKLLPTSWGCLLAGSNCLGDRLTSM